MTRLFNADYYSENLNHPAISESPSYISRNADDTVSLGRAFADAVRSMRGISRRENAPVRIGVMAPSGTGKSTFIRGVVADLSGYHTVEINTNFRVQQTFKHTNRIKGWLRHYDASLDDNNGLPSYLANDLSEFGMPFVDLVEHPSDDLYDKEFNCLIFMEKQTAAIPSGAHRTLTFLTDASLRHSEGFRMFTNRAAPFREQQKLLPPPGKTL